MTDTANLALPCIEGSQAQKHVTHNDALRVLDTLVQLAVLDRDLTAPPGSPSEGQRWIVKLGATGAWSGHANAIAAWQDGAWSFSAPQIGWSAYVVDEGTLLVWNGSAWGDFFSTVTAIQNLAMLGIGTTADATNPLSAKLNNALFTAKTVADGGSGDLRYKLNKEAAANTLSLLFQNNYSGRAEIGLTGDDDFHFKLSPDGSSWFEGLTISRADGGVRFLMSDSNVASASTCDIGAASSLKVTITGSSAINSFGTTVNSLRFIRFAGALTLTHNATSLILPGAANIVTAAGDCAIATSDALGNWRVRHYQRSDGTAVVTRTPQIDVFTASGTYAVPTWAKRIRVVAIAGGAGGGSGASGDNSANRFGGGGGGNGGLTIEEFRTADIGTSLTVTVGAGGAGGTGVTGNSTGVAGSGGGATSVYDGGTWLIDTRWGFGGGGGSTTSGIGSGSWGMYGGNTGGSSSVTAAGGASSSPSIVSAGAGGGGGGIDTSGNARDGGGGGVGYFIGGNSHKTTAAAGGTAGGAGSAGLAKQYVYGEGGGGGGGAASISGNGGAGGVGGSPGGGGGGGGASRNTATSGAGGNGGNGEVRITAYS